MLPEGGLTIIENIWKFGNLPYLVANTYGLNFIKIRGTWFFRGQKPPVSGDYNTQKKLKFWESTLFSG